VLKQCDVKRIEIHVEEVPKNNSYWKKVGAIERVDIVPLDVRSLMGLAGLKYADYAHFLSNGGVNHKSDFIRYLLLAVYGGVYLDFDTLVVKNLGPLLDVEFFAGRQKRDIWGNDINGAIMGSRKDGDLILKCISKVRNLRRFGRTGTIKDLEVLFNKLLMPNRYRWAEAGPCLLTKLVREKQFAGTVYPIEYFQFWHHEHWQEIFSPGHLDERIYVIHHYGSRSMKETEKIDEKNIWYTHSVFADAARKMLETQTSV